MDKKYEELLNKSKKVLLEGQEDKLMDISLGFGSVIEECSIFSIAFDKEGKKDKALMMSGIGMKIIKLSELFNDFIEMRSSLKNVK